ncbi:MAG TPA: hypothetical protein VIT44_05775 [Cyclobacteriaceae bacterium]
MIKIKILLAVGGLLLAASCKEAAPLANQEYTFDFSNGTQEWKSFFSDYPVGAEIFYKLEFTHTGLPVPLDVNSKAIKVSGSNGSGSLLSMTYRKFDHLRSNTDYSITFDIELASDIPSNAIGAGSSPNLCLGAGGVAYEPTSQVDEQDQYQPRFESTLQSGLSNEVFKVLGRIGVSDDDVNVPFTLINRNNLSDPIVLRSNDKGELWLLIGVDSGFEGQTTLYYKNIKVNFQEQAKI